MCIHTHPHTHVHTEICLLSSAAQQALGPQRRIKAASKLSGKKRRCYIPPATFCRITENVFNGAAELYISTLLVKKKKKGKKEELYQHPISHSPSIKSSVSEVALH